MAAGDGGNDVEMEERRHLYRDNNGSPFIPEEAGSHRPRPRLETNHFINT
jgi:hypothetical protein